MILSRTRHRAHGFTLIELLTVVFIIGVLIAILVPAVNSARNAAKNAKTGATLRAIETALEMFKTDNGSAFSATGGFPPSFSYPKIHKDYSFNSWEGQFPFVGSSGSNPVVYGAQWLPAMLMGEDLRGFVQRSDVPPSLRAKPYEWYKQQPEGQDHPLPRMPLYLNPEEVRLIKTGAVSGRSLDQGVMFPDWDEMKDLPVIGDSFDQPILYYAANAHGSATNMLSRNHRQPPADYGSEGGPPVFFHQDNVGYTGTSSGGSTGNGWDFSSRRLADRPPEESLHHIKMAGDRLNANEIDVGQNRFTFAHYIHDKNAHSRAPDGATNWPLKAVRDKSYLLITAGIDGRYGTNDDVSNIPKFEDVE